MLSWLVAGIAAVGVVYSLVAGRRRRRRYGFTLRPVWIDVGLGAVGILVVVGAVWVANSYMWPPGLAEAYALEHGIQVPPGGLRSPPGSPCRSCWRSASPWP